MNHLQSLIQQGESEHLEFKASFGKEAIAEIYHHEDKTIIALSVISYPIKPISFKGKYYKRVHNANHLMDLNEIANEHLKTINLSWDFARDPSHDINDISLKKVNRFIENSNRFRDYPINDDPLTVLKKFELVRDNTISFGCFLRTPAQRR